MIKKFIDIEGVGKFTDYHAGSKTFPAELHRINAIYADNGSGKTTLAQILKSTGISSPLCITSRKSFTTDNTNQFIKLLCEDGVRTFSSGHWDSHFQRGDLDVEVFDAEYAEANVYVMTMGNGDHPGTFFELVVGEKAIKLFEERKKIFSIRKKEKNRRSGWSRKLKQGVAPEIESGIKNRIDESKRLSERLSLRIRDIEKELDNLAFQFGCEYVDEINKFLRIFAPNLEITQLNKRANKFVYHLKINGAQVRNDSESISLRRTFSEGEKNAIAFSFFLSRLKIKKNLENTIVVFDDPITSFDYKRRNSTKIKLAAIAKRCNQFFLLSHDITFVKDFTDYLKGDDVLNLKLKFDGNTAYICQHDIRNETLRGIFKDLTVLHDFVKNADRSEYIPRQVIRCIRPILEGFLKIKYFGIIDDNKWLGDILNMIRESSSESVLHSQMPNYDELSELNDYTAQYHHGDSLYLEDDINEQELRQYCQRTIELLFKL